MGKTFGIGYTSSCVKVQEPLSLYIQKKHIPWLSSDDYSFVNWLMLPPMKAVINGTNMKVK